jgi:hypothetical protein
MESIAVISHVSLGSILRSHSRCVRRNFELHSPVDSTLAFSPSKLYRIRDRMQVGAREAERAAWGILEGEGKGGREGGFNGESSPWFMFVFHIGT